MKNHRRFTGLLLMALMGLLVFTVGLLAVPAAAQEPSADIEEEMYRIADKLNCPLCQGQRLSECPLTVCQEMRAEITQWLQEGRQEPEIIETFVERYGTQVLNQPPIEGFNLLAWVIPIVAVLLVVAIGVWIVRRWLQRASAVTSEPVDPSEPALPEEYVRRLEEEVARDQ